MSSKRVYTWAELREKKVKRGDREADSNEDVAKHRGGCRKRSNICGSEDEYICRELEPVTFTHSLESYQDLSAFVRKYIKILL